MWARGAPRVPSQEIRAPKLAEWNLARACRLLTGCPAPILSSIRPRRSMWALQGLGSVPGVLFSLPGQSWTLLAPTTTLEALSHGGGEPPE